jgi:carbonic anhydrase
VLHVDFKVPSEHLLEGERFDGEMQIVHLNPLIQRIAIEVALIKATDMGYNYYFEQALQAFEAQYEADKADCLRGVHHNRGRRSQEDTNTTIGKKEFNEWDDVSINGNRTIMDEQFTTQGRRRQQTTPPIGIWDPHHAMLVPSLYFWRYDGSLTDPPCGEFVTWFVSDKAMTISTDQLRRMKQVLFTHVDRNCEQTSVQFDESVARPVQSTAGRPVWHCTSENYAPDTGIIA